MSIPETMSPPRLRAPAATRSRDARRIATGYYGALLSMPAMDILLSGAFVSLAGVPEALLWRLPEIIVILIAMNLAGGWLLFRPVARFLKGSEQSDGAVRRLENLTAWTGLWALCVSTLFAVSAFLVTPFAVHGLPAEPGIIATLSARAMAWSVLLPFTAYFLIHEQVRQTRRWLFATHGLSPRAGRGKLGAKMAFLVAGGALVPAASVAVTLGFVPETSPLTGQPRSLVILVILFGSALALGVALYATLKSLTASLAALTDGMDRIRAGDYGHRVTIDTDDELGRLSDGYNALARALEESRAETRAKEAERERAARQFHTAQKRAALGRLAGGIAHDFNNLLAIIIGYADMTRMKLGKADPNSRRMDEVMNASMRGKALIKRLLAFTRDGARTRQRFDVSAAVRETLTWLESTAIGSKDLRSSFPDEPVMLDGDPTGIHQIVANLCLNAAHAMGDDTGVLSVSVSVEQIDGGRATGLRRSVGDSDPPILVESDRGAVEADAELGSRGWIDLLQPGPHVLIAVSDTGCGMDSETIAQIFDPYYTTKPEGEGSGLGLSAVLGITRDHGGAIAIRSQPGHGTTIDVLLPLTRDNGSPQDGEDPHH